MAAEPHRHRAASARGGVCLLAALALGGCAIYRPRPLEENPKPADATALARTAGAIKRPRLAPLPIPPHGPWNDLQLADIAIVASPDLQALRAQAQVADAQVFAAGLLPDPQIGIGADV
ncbi:MAG: TolC family protein, partial [Rudaea sp.]